MTVRELITQLMALKEEDLDCPVLIASDEEGNRFNYMSYVDQDASYNGSSGYQIEVGGRDLTSEDVQEHPCVILWPG